MRSDPSGQGELFERLKVLIVDDSAEMRRMLEALLAAMGIGETICAPDGNAGLRMFAERAPDVVITDGAMQPMDGYAMTRAIRAMRGAPADKARNQGPDIPVLMLSGHVGSDMLARARDDGVTDYIVKPVSPQLLYERLLEAVARPVHVVETATYRGPSPTRRLVARRTEN
jgi:CheY-like chemotaxis protein